MQLLLQLFEFFNEYRRSVQSGVSKDLVLVFLVLELILQQSLVVSVSLPRFEELSHSFRHLPQSELGLSSLFLVSGIGIFDESSKPILLALPEVAFKNALRVVGINDDSIAMFHAVLKLTDVVPLFSRLISFPQVAKTIVLASFPETQVLFVVSSCVFEVPNSTYSILFEAAIIVKRVIAQHSLDVLLTI